jgi:hypothetical protein
MYILWPHLAIAVVVFSTLERVATTHGAMFWQCWIGSALPKKVALRWCRFCGGPHGLCSLVVRNQEVPCFKMKLKKNTHRSAVRPANARSNFVPRLWFDEPTAVGFGYSSSKFVPLKTTLFASLYRQAQAGANVVLTRLWQR